MSPTTKRLLREAKELSPHSPNPSPHFHAAPLSDSDLFEWHFTLLGAPSSPYEKGIYHGRIVLPPQYPLRPPSFRFLTPSGRFEVNREICLSISGHHEETWQPAWGIRTALTAIRAFMSAGSAGQVGGMEASDSSRREWAGKSRVWKCAACGGKTNEEILKEWLSDVREAGGSFNEGEGDDSLPEGLKVGYKDEMVKGKTENKVSLGTAGDNAAGGKEQTQQDPMRKDSPELREPAVGANATSQASSPPQSAPNSRTVSIQQTQQSQTPVSLSSAEDISQTRSRTRTDLQSQVQAQAPTSNDASALWIDRAIIGVFIALMFMILRKVYAPYS